MAWKEIVGLAFNQAGFDRYCHSLRWNQWRPNFVTIHNTGAPNLAQRPQGFLPKHMQNFVHYYKVEQGWSAGPHLFIDDHQIWVFTPLTVSGVHSPSWNKVAIGIEMLGDYNRDDFNKGRGAKVKANAYAATATLCAVTGMDPDGIRFHFEDPETTHRGCPGKSVDKPSFINGVKTLMRGRHAGEHVMS